MTDEELQKFENANVRLVYGGQRVTGKLITGYAAQIRVKAPYAIQWYDTNEKLGTNEERLVAIERAEMVESIEPLNESETAAAEVEDAAEHLQTPG